MSEQAVDPKVFISKKKGLKLHIQAERKHWDDRRREYVTIPGVYAKFVDGKFVAKTKEEIDYLDEYCKKHPEEAFPITKKNERLAKAMEKVKEEEEAAKAKEKKKKKKGGQGVMGATNTAPPQKKRGPKAGQGAIS